MQLATMTDQTIAAALAVPVADSPVVRTVAGAFDTYALAVERQVERAGGVPSPLRLSTPANAAERAALRLFLAELRRAGAHAKIRLV
jgi:hypothetical protein